MNSKAIYATCLFAALNICTISARAESTVKHETYTYGTHLDIKTVLSTLDDGDASCGVVNSRINYLDSHGQSRVLDYSKFAEACNQGG